MVLSRFLALCLFIASTIAQPVDGNAPSSAIPIAVGGKDPEIAKAVIALMLPEYDGMATNPRTMDKIVPR